MCFPIVGVVGNDDKRVQVVGQDVLQHTCSIRRLLEVDDIGTLNRVNLFVRLVFLSGHIHIVTRQHAIVAGLLSGQTPHGILEQSDDGFSISSLLESRTIRYRPRRQGITIVEGITLFYLYTLYIGGLISLQSDGCGYLFLGSCSSQRDNQLHLILLRARHYRHTHHTVVEIIVAWFREILLETIGERIVIRIARQRSNRFVFKAHLTSRSCKGHDSILFVGGLDGSIEGSLSRRCRKQQGMEPTLCRSRCLSHDLRITTG